MVPVGVPASEVTVTLSATVWPKFDGFGVELRVVVVAALLTTRVSPAEVDAEKSIEPR